MKKIIIILIFIFANACSNESSIEINKNEVNFKIDLDKVFAVDFSSVFDSLRIFQPNDAAIVASADDILLHKNYVIIVDFLKLKQVQVFDISGKFLFDIKATGKGPKEFKVPLKVRVNSAGDKLLIYCSLTKKILEFDFKGNFIREVGIPEIGLLGDFIEKDEEILFIDALTNSRAQRIGKLNLRTYEKDKNINYLVNPSPFFRIFGSKDRYLFNSLDDSKVLFKDLYSNYLVEYDWDGSFETYVFEINNNQLYLDSSDVYQLYEIKELLNNNYYNTIGEGVVSSKNWKMIPIGEGLKNIGTLIFSTAEKKLIPVLKFNNDMDQVFTFSSVSSQSFSLKGDFLFKFDYQFLTQRLDNMDLDKNPYRGVLEKFKGNENENPIFFIYSLKDDFNFEF
ncbi:MAG: 6-bladed beta-propeller [Bacteroidota bacterium]